MASLSPFAHIQPWWSFWNTKLITSYNSPYSTTLLHPHPTSFLDDFHGSEDIESTLCVTYKAYKGPFLPPSSSYAILTLALCSSLQLSSMFLPSYCSPPFQHRGLGYAIFCYLCPPLTWPSNIRLSITWGRLPWPLYWWVPSPLQYFL